MEEAKPAEPKPAEPYKVENKAPEENMMAGLFGDEEEEIPAKKEEP